MISESNRPISTSHSSLQGQRRKVEQLVEESKEATPELPGPVREKQISRTEDMAMKAIIVIVIIVIIILVIIP